MGNVKSWLYRYSICRYILHDQEITSICVVVSTHLMFCCCLGRNEHVLPHLYDFCDAQNSTDYDRD